MKSKPAWLCITIADYLLNRRSLCRDFNSCFELFEERLKKKSKIKILPRPGLFITYHSELLDESLWEIEKT